MYGIVLGACMCLEIFVIVTLHTQYGLYTQYGIQVGVFSASFLTASPTGITEDVYVRTPESQLRIARVINNSHGYVEYIMVRTVPIGSCFVRYGREYIVNQLLIESSCHTDRLRIYGISILAYTMTSFAPPVVRRNAETVYRYGFIHHQSHFFFRSE